MKSVGDFARVRLAHTPTPLQFMARLTRHLAAAPLWIKRDDCTGLAMGGNKARQLEFHFGAAQAQGATAVLITGAVQSNYACMTAAAAARLGMACHIQAENRVDRTDEEYRGSGNVLLGRLFGARVHPFPVGEDEAAADAELARLADVLRTEGHTPYVIQLGADHVPLGALGYVEAAEEMLGQASETGAPLDAVVVGSGSAVTHAGLLVGLRIAGSNAVVHGMCVRRPATQQKARVLHCVRLVEELLEIGATVQDDDVVVHDACLGGGYGVVGEDTREALDLLGRMEGILLDPVYTAKAFAGLCTLVRDDAVKAARNVVFVHTGGTPALFAYRRPLAPQVDPLAQ